MTATRAEIDTIIDEFRNGANGFYEHWAVKRFIYSDGVRDLAIKASCYWLLDIVATEIVPMFLKAQEPSMAISVIARARSALITGSFSDGSRDYSRDLSFADLPDCEFTLLLGWGDETTASLILLSEY